MAQIIKKESHLEREFSGKTPKKRPSILWMLLALAVTVAGFLPNQPVVVGIGIAALMITVGLYARGRKRYDANKAALGAGIAGEYATAGLIRQLPEGYFGIQNPVVTYQGKTSELDMVVVGPGGVFIIETKNHNGRIVGRFDQQNWVQHKTGRAGGSYQKELYNPVKQVGTHVYRLAHFLRERGIRVHVTGMVFFTNPAASVEVYGTPGDIPVFAGQTGANLLCRQIVGGGQGLSADSVMQICQLLRQCI